MPTVAHETVAGPRAISCVPSARRRLSPRRVLRLGQSFIVAGSLVGLYLVYALGEDGCGLLWPPNQNQRQKSLQVVLDLGRQSSQTHENAHLEKMTALYMGKPLL